MVCPLHEAVHELQKSTGLPALLLQAPQSMFNMGEIQIPTPMMLCLPGNQVLLPQHHSLHRLLKAVSELFTVFSCSDQSEPLQGVSKLGISFVLRYIFW